MFLKQVLSLHAPVCRNFHRPVTLGCNFGPPKAFMNGFLCRTIIRESLKFPKVPGIVASILGLEVTREKEVHTAISSWFL